MSVTAEDAHQEHECIDMAIIAPAYPYILPDKERHHALRCQIHHRASVKRERSGAPGQEEQQEKRGKTYPLGAVSCTRQPAGQPYEQREQRGIREQYCPKPPHDHMPVRQQPNQQQRGGKHQCISQYLLIVYPHISCAPSAIRSGAVMTIGKDTDLFPYTRP